MSKEELKSLKSNSPVGRIFDFPHYLSPMLVKELRQGLRSIGFTGLFIVMQSLLGFIILMMLISNANAEPSLVSGAVFAIYIVATCGIQPLRGINAIGAEVKGDTIDLVIITRLTSWKIVYGKWFSLMAQSLIFSVSLLPYLILRYFLGDMNLFHELFIFASVFVVASLCTAIAVGCSAISSAVLRYVISTSLVGTLFIMTMSFVMKVVERYDEFNSLFSLGLVSLMLYFYLGLGLVIFGSYLIWMFLDFGASMIAPLSENRSTLRRMIYLLLLIVACTTCIIARFNMDTYSPLILMIQFLLMGTFVPFFIVTYTEGGFLSSRIAMSIRKKPLLSRFRYFIYPGWASGSAFLFFCIIIQLAMVTILLPSDAPAIHSFRPFSNFDVDDVMILYTILTCIVGSLVFPAMAVSLFAKSITNRLGIYLIIFIVSLIITMLVAFFSEVLREDNIRFLFIWLPSVNFYSLFQGRESDNVWLGLVNSILIVLYFIVVYIKSMFVWSHISEQEKQAVEAIKKETIK